MSGTLDSSNDGQVLPITDLPEANEKIDLESFRRTKDAKALVDWVHAEQKRAKEARHKKEIQWWVNMSFFYGNQWSEIMGNKTPQGFANKMVDTKKPYYQMRHTVNRTRSFVRAEQAKFLAAVPQAVAVPATAEDEDVRAAYAAEQTWQSISENRKLRKTFTKASWWTIITGNGFIKTWWDSSIIPDRNEPANKGNISFGTVTPFHLFVPDLREQEIEDQPFIITLQTKSVAWVKRFYSEALNGIDIKASTSSENTILEEGYLNLASAGRPADSVTVYECWAKPGATEYLPDGGVVVIIESTIVGFYREGLPYTHDEYPYTKFEHIPTATFYADSPLVDTNELQKEYNQLRSEISTAGRRMAKPQLLAQKGSIIPSRITNEPGLVIEYRPGTPPPTPLQLTPLPQYYVEQQDRIKADWEDLTGQHEVSRGTAPTGVTAGTAINYLQERDDSFLAPQYESMEEGYGRIASQSLQIFAQYVDMPRKIKTIGSDQSFDTMLLTGADIKNGTDIRIEKGSSVGVSKAAKEAKVMDMFAMGLIDQVAARKMMEVGGVQKILDIMNVAERKAMRENMKMKALKPEEIAQAEEEFQSQIEQALSENPEMQAEFEAMGGQMPPMPAIISVDTFDVHEVHIDSHNKFRMGQEYEMLDPSVRAEIDKHVDEHTKMYQQAQMANFLQQIPEEGASQLDEQGSLDVTTGEDPASADGLGGNVAGNGAVPAPQTEG